MLEAPSPRLASGTSDSHSSHARPEGMRGEGRGEGQHTRDQACDAPADATIWQSGSFQRDTWAKSVDGEALPDAPVILSKKRWLIEREALAARNMPLGLKLEPGETLDDIAGDLAHFSVIALNFPKFSDGRAFSAASLLRDKHGFKGELRAVGNVLSDQIPLMRRVGFDTFEVTHVPTRKALLEGRLAEVRLHYQPAIVIEPPAGTRPWLRRTSG